MDQAGASDTLSVCVIRKKCADVGANVMVVCGPSPVPVATGSLHVTPSADTCTE
jgi:hypothetical protein